MWDGLLGAGFVGLSLAFCVQDSDSSVCTPAWHPELRSDHSAARAWAQLSCPDAATAA